MFDCLSFSRFASTLTHTHFTCFLFQQLLFIAVFFWRTHTLNFTATMRAETLSVFGSMSTNVCIFINYKITFNKNFFLISFWHFLLICGARRLPSVGTDVWIAKHTPTRHAEWQYDDSNKPPALLAHESTKTAVQIVWECQKNVHCFVRMAHRQCDHAEESCHSSDYWYLSKRVGLFIVCLELIINTWTVKKKWNMESL